MRILEKYKKQYLEFEETTTVKTGVVCHVYSFPDDDSKDFGAIQVKKGHKTPLQKVMSGTKTLEVYKSGKGILTVTRTDGSTVTYHYPEDQTESVEVSIGECMQWEALEDLQFYEICYPPYQEGRFQDLE